MGSDKLELFFLLIPVVLLSLTLHELAHGWVAYALGDPTAKLLGRLSPNPIRHLDPLGTAMFAISYWSGFLFGWAKPVPVDPRNLRGHPQRSMALIAVAGPITNFLLAILFAAILVHGSWDGKQFELLVLSLQVNVVLGVFNLFPIPPLDGSRILGAFMDRRTYAKWSELDQYGMVFLLVLLLVFNQQFGLLLDGATEHVYDAVFNIVQA